MCLFTHLSSRFRYLTPCPCVCSVLIIVTCPVMIVVTCPSSPCVYSLCVPVVSLPVRLSFLRVVSVPAISHVNTSPCDTDPCLPYRLCFCLFPTGTSVRSSTCVPNLDWSYIDPCRCLPLVGFVYLLLDCLIVYRTRKVKRFDLLFTPVSESAIESCTKH